MALNEERKRKKRESGIDPALFSNAWYLIMLYFTMNFIVFVPASVTTFAK